MQTTNYSLPELLERASRKNLTIPQFQRNFTWNREQIRLIVDSLSRSYPIGSLLLLLANSEFKIGSRSIEAEIREEQNHPNDDGQPAGHTDEEHYILDGQQRITSIFRVFRNADPDKLWYFNLKGMLEQHDSNGTSWLRHLNRKAGEKPPERKERNRLLRADIILDQSKTDVYVSEYIEDSGDFGTDKTVNRQNAAKLKGIFETIRNYKVPVVVLERNSGVESVCRVFETINSTGTRLTTFDLAVARFFPKPADLDLRNMWEETLKQHQVLKDFEVDGERVLQVLYLLSAARRGTSPDPTRSNLFKLESSEIEKDWSRSSQALAETFRWARALGARPKAQGLSKRTLPNENLLVSLAAVRSLQQHKTGTNSLENDLLVRRWYFSKVMKGGVQASNYTISRDFRDLKQYSESIKPLVPEEVFLDVETIMSLKPSDVRYKSLQNVFAITMREDLFGNILDQESELDDHHIFPHSAHKRDGFPKNMLDSICNRILLSRSTRPCGRI